MEYSRSEEPPPPCHRARKWKPDTYGRYLSVHTGGWPQGCGAHLCVYIGSKLRRVEAYLYVALSSQIVNLGRFHLVHHLDDTHRVAEIGIVKMEVGLAFQVGDTLTIVD